MAKVLDVMSDDCAAVVADRRSDRSIFLGFGDCVIWFGGIGGGEMKG